MITGVLIDSVNYGVWTLLGCGAGSEFESRIPGQLPG